MIDFLSTSKEEEEDDDDNEEEDETNPPFLDMATSEILHVSKTFKVEILNSKRST